MIALSTQPNRTAPTVGQRIYSFGPYFIEPVIAGIENGKPYICAMDLIGAPMLASDVALAGTATEALYGMSESLYRPDMEPEELFEVISQCMLASVNRDALSGWGAQVVIMYVAVASGRVLQSVCLSVARSLFMNDIDCC
jgi:20S proteasome subunit beta 3